MCSKQAAGGVPSEPARKNVHLVGRQLPGNDAGHLAGRKLERGQAAKGAATGRDWGACPGQLHSSLWGSTNALPALQSR